MAYFAKKKVTSLINVFVSIYLKYFMKK